MKQPAILANAEQNRNNLRRAQAEALTNDVREGMQRALQVWNKTFNARLAALSAGEHTIAIFQGTVIAVAQQAAALTIVNPASDHEWLRTMLLQQFAEAFDGTRADALKPAATPTEQ